MARILTGIQSTGRPHLGNLLGAIIPAIELSKNKKVNFQLEEKINDYDTRLDFLEKKKSEVEKMHRSQIEQLEVISSLSGEDAKEQLLETLKEEAKTDAMAYIQSTVEEAKLTAQ